MLLNFFCRSLLSNVKFSSLNPSLPQIATGNNFGASSNLLSETSILNAYLEIFLTFFNKL
jgi:hypothetical protein